jgi:predicted nucleic acid-binding protein
MSDSSPTPKFSRKSCTVTGRSTAAIQPAFEAILEVVDDVLAIEKPDVLRAAEILQLPGHWSARDAVHIAIMERHQIRRIMSFDADFDRWPGLSRIFQV